MDKDENIIRILSIDPSTSHMGISIIDVNIKIKTKFELIYCRTIHGENVNYHVDDNCNDLGMLARVNGLGRALKELINICKPNEVICEDNYQGRNVSTFKTLITVMINLKNIVHGEGLYFDTVYPNPAKEIVGANFKGTTKDDVTKGVRKYKYLNLNEIDLDKLDDHAIDSIAIGLYKAEEISKYYKTYLGE